MEQELLRLVKLARAGDREAFTRLVLSQEGCSPGWLWAS